MTMFPAHLSSSNYGGGGRYDCFISLGGGFSDLMAEDESRTQTNEETGSSSKDNIHDEMNTDDDPDRWLQLSLGGGHMQSSTNHRHQIAMPPPPPPPPPQQLIFQVPEFRGTSTSFFLQPHEAVATINSVPPTTLQLQQQEPCYNYFPLTRPYSALNPPVSSSSSFSSSSEHARPLHVHRRITSRMDLRVVNPPRRPHSGFWFMLHASQNQAKEPFLPQIPKSYLRIKDGRMTVGLLVKYLVNKLQLGSESEIEVTCKGHQLALLSTLQHVRETIWNSPRNDGGLMLVPRSSATINHLMVLHYGRIA